MKLPRVSVERALAQLRWRPDDFFEESLLRHIVAHEGYWLVLRDGEPMLAPDDERARRLAAVFTSTEARDAFLRDEHIAPADVSLRRLDGRALFATLRERSYVGVVFNCAGPDPPLAFIMALLERAQPLCDEPRDARPITDAERIDFDAMAADAYPNQQPGDRRNVDRLWRATYALPAWFAVLHTQPANTLLTRHDNERRLSGFLFTDARRAERFIDINQLAGPPDAATPAAVVGSLDVATVLECSRRGRFPTPVERLHFNFGGPGWFSPADNLARLYDHLQTHPS
ncbi:MAG: hypothetical protein JNL19_05640 [Burkholderiales bacterium]|nr:hypothetical protein [Burkholderiales bacterium]